MPKSVYERLGKSTLVGVDKTARRHIYKGSSLPAIAAHEYGTNQYDSELWRQLAEYNGIDDVYDIAIGAVLTIPRPSPTE
jgi:nucleoid-associated protein YgaU